MAEIVAPEIGAASDAAKVTLASDVGRDNVQALKLLCPELLGSLRIGRRAASAGPKRISSAKSAKSEKQQREWVRPVTGKGGERTQARAMSRPGTQGQSRPGTKGGLGETQKSAGAIK